MIPVLEALRSLLIGDAAIVTAVSDGTGGYRIYGPDRVMPQLKPPLPKSIVLNRIGGLVQTPQTRPRTRIRCYGKNVQEAEALYRMLYPLFYNAQGMPIGMRLIASRWLLYGGQLTEPDTSIEATSGWPVSSGILNSVWAAQELAV